MDRQAADIDHATATAGEGTVPQERIVPIDQCRELWPDVDWD